MQALGERSPASRVMRPPRAVRPSVFAVAIAFTFLAACSSKQDHPPNAGECSGDAACLGVGGPPNGGGGGRDAGGDATTDGGGDAATVAIGGSVYSMSSFTREPSTGLLDTSSTTLVVRGTHLDGTGAQSSVIAGQYSIADLGRNQPLTWVRLFDVVPGRTEVLRTLFAFPPSNVPALTLPIPLYPPELARSTALSVGIPTTVDGTGTIVLQVADSTGAGRAGVTASKLTGAFGPYYDDADSVTLASATGARGTIVFLGVTAAAAGQQIVLSFGGPTGSTIAFTPTVAPDVVTFSRFAWP